MTISQHIRACFLKPQSNIFAIDLYNTEVFYELLGPVLVQFLDQFLQVCLGGKRTKLATLCVKQTAWSLFNTDTRQSWTFISSCMWNRFSLNVLCFRVMRHEQQCQKTWLHLSCALCAKKKFHKEQWTAVWHPY